MKHLKQLRDERGAAVVEFAVVVPLLLLLVFGIIEFGFLIYNKSMLTNASREGARFGIVMRNPRASTAQIQNVVANYCQDFLITFAPSNPPPTTRVFVKEPSDPSPVERSPSAGLASALDLVIVEVQYQYEFLLIPAFITDMGLTKTIVASTTMRAE